MPFKTSQDEDDVYLRWPREREHSSHAGSALTLLNHHAHPPFPEGYLSELDSTPSSQSSHPRATRLSTSTQLFSPADHYEIQETSLPPLLYSHPRSSIANTQTLDLAADVPKSQPSSTGSPTQRQDNFLAKIVHIRDISTLGSVLSRWPSSVLDSESQAQAQAWVQQLWEQAREAWEQAREAWEQAWEAWEQVREQAWEAWEAWEQAREAWRQAQKAWGQVWEVWEQAREAREQGREVWEQAQEAREMQGREAQNREEAQNRWEEEALGQKQTLPQGMAKTRCLQREPPDPGHVLYISLQCGTCPRPSVLEIPDSLTPFYVDPDVNVNVNVDDTLTSTRPRTILHSTLLDDHSNHWLASVHPYSSIWLPIELWEWVIDYIAGQNYMHVMCDLLACALSCLAWLPQSQFHLITLQCSISGAKSLSTYAHILRRYPNLASCVHQVDIQASANPALLHWINLLLRQLAPCLPQLNSISFSGAFNGKFIMHPTFNRSLLLLNSVTELDLSVAVRLGTVNFIARLACSLRKLCKLRIGVHTTEPE